MLLSVMVRALKLPMLSLTMLAPCRPPAMLALVSALLKVASPPLSVSVASKSPAMPRRESPVTLSEAMDAAWMVAVAIFAACKSARLLPSSMDAPDLIS